MCLRSRWQRGFPGCCDLAYRREQHLKERYYQLVSEAREDEAVLFLSTHHKANREFTEFAEHHLGPRAVVCRLLGDRDEYRRVLGAEFFEGLEQDRAEAERRRGLPAGGLPEDELGAWMRSKAWALDLHMQLTERGYTYDPASVEFVALGEDWSYCAATYPIHMGRALGLAKPIERRFDLMNPDESQMLLEARPVDQNLPMPEQIRLFIFETADQRYVAQYWEGIRGIMDPPHVVTVDFPAETVQEVNLWGIGIERAVGLDQPFYGRMTVSVGAGGHTPYRSTLVMVQSGLPRHSGAEPQCSLEDFRAALLAGEVSEVQGA